MAHPLAPPVLTVAMLGWAAALSIALFAGLCFVLSPVAAAATACLAFAMGLITLADFRHFIIPDVLSLPAIPGGLLANAVVFHGGNLAAGLGEGVTGALAGAGVFFLLRYAYRRYRGVEGLGMGDVKLAAVAGAWLGPGLLAPACMVAAMSAIIGTLLLALLPGRPRLHARMHIPFGSFIAPTILLFWILKLQTAMFIDF